MELFEDALERVRRRYLFAVAGYVVMPEHVHLLVNEPRRALLSKVIQALKLSVSMRSRERPFWQAHYYDFNVAAHEKFVEKLRYIHRNPVRRGLVAQPEDWQWSSFRHYQTGIGGTVEVESDWTARQRGWQLPEWMRDPPGCLLDLPGPQRRGTGGTLEWMKFSLRLGPPTHRPQGLKPAFLIERFAAWLKPSPDTRPSHSASVVPGSENRGPGHPGSCGVE
jgi:putative transposase